MARGRAIPALRERRARGGRMALVLLAALALQACGQGGGAELRGATMGTFYTVKVSRLPPGLAEASLQAGLEGVLDRIIGRLSTYEPDSELSRFNAAETTGWFPVSPETMAVVEEALAVSRLTGGAFDVTVGPLVDLWGFGPEPRPEAPPSAEAVDAARERVGWERLHVRRAPPALRKEHPRARVDLSAIAKGYAVDQLAEHLESQGVEAYMVEIGGEVRARGARPPGGPWRIGVERPLAGGRSVQRVLYLEEGGVATSGDYRNFIEVDGERLSHTIDPRTGRPVSHRLASVTVLASSCMRADALATGLMALGPQRAAELAERERIAALFMIRSGDGFEEVSTPGIAEALAGRDGA